MAEAYGEKKSSRASHPGSPRRPAGERRAAQLLAREPTIRDLRQTLREGRWVILAVLVISVSAAAGYVLVTPPTYRAAALLQIEPRPEGGRKLEDLSALFEPGASAPSEIEILRSRLVVGTAVDRLGQDVRARPHWFPVVGQAIARRWRGAAPGRPPMSLESLAPYAWGGEAIGIRWMRLPEALLGHPFTLTALGGGRYRLSGEGGATVLEGEVGSPASADAGGGRVELLVEQLVARPGTRFDVEKPGRPVLIDDLLRHLTVNERGAGTNVVSVTYESSDARDAAAVVSAVCSAYLQQVAEKSQAEAGRTLAFLDTQLPQLRSDLESAESALNRYREKQGTVDLPLEAKAAVDRGLELDRTIDEMTVKRAEVAHRYTDQHPEVRLLDQQIAAAQAERDAVRAHKVTMPQTQLDAARLVRNVDMAAELYLTLEKKAQELRVVKSGRVGEARVVDWPTVPYRPVRPVPGLVLGLGLLLGLSGGVAAALGRRAMDHNAEDPRDIEDGTGLPVFVNIPHSAREVSLQRSAGRGRRVPLALAAPDDPATETLRTLRTALGFVLKARGKVIAVSSPSAAVGKSFVCANLAQLIAAAGQRVLLVDADLRQGRLHRYFSAEQSPGLSDVLSGEATLEDAIRSTGTAGLDVLPRGEPAYAPAELLARPRLAEILATAASRYDVILVDTPPILAVTDGLLVARSASVNLLVLRARQHPLPEIAEALELFARSGVAIQGGILNDSRPGSGYARAYQRRAAMVVPRVSRAAS